MDVRTFAKQAIAETNGADKLMAELAFGIYEELLKTIRDNARLQAYAVARAMHASHSQAAAILEDFEQLQEPAEKS